MSASYKTVSIEEKLIEEIDEKAIGKLGYTSRAEFIKDAIRRRLEEMKREAKKP